MVIDEPHPLAAARYIMLNPVVAGLVSRAEDWPWSSARAHLVGEDDELATVAPLRALIPDFAALLTAPGDPATTAQSSGRPPSDDRSGAGIGRSARAGPLRPCTRQPGPKPRTQGNTGREPPLPEESSKLVTVTRRVLARQRCVIRGLFCPLTCRAISARNSNASSQPNLPNGTRPPSTARSCLVMNDAASLARNTAALAMSPWLRRAELAAQLRTDPI